MPRLRMEQRQSPEMRQESRQILKIEQANLLEMPGEEFHKLIAEVEKNPLFRRLYQKERLIHYQRFPRTDVSSSLYQLKEEVVADKGSLDIESLLLNKEYVVRQIQNLGLEKFKRCFLFPETGMTEEELAGECDLTVSEVRKINSLINEFSVLSEFYQPSALGSGGIHYHKIASVERGQEGFVIGYFSTSFARGRYIIDYQRFEEVKADGVFTEAEVRQAKQLFKRLELINSCKHTINQIVQNIVEKQALYLESGDARALLPFSQKELAQKIGLAPSSVSRAISGKSIDTPWGQEVPIKQFFPRPRRFKKELIRRLLESETGLTSDEGIRAKLEDKFGVAISRRTIASLRKELKLPGLKKKETSYTGG